MNTTHKLVVLVAYATICMSAFHHHKDNLLRHRRVLLNIPQCHTLFVSHDIEYQLDGDMTLNPTPKHFFKAHRTLCQCFLKVEEYVLTSKTLSSQKSLNDELWHSIKVLRESEV